MSRLIKNGQIVNDAWQRLVLAEGEAADSATLPNAQVIFPLAVCRRNALPSSPNRIRSASGSTAMKVRKNWPTTWNSSPSSP